jgi:hypothetical protein
MPKSEFAKNLDIVQAKVAAFLKPLGFHKKGRTHNRTTAGGLVHALDFQMGAYPIGKQYVVPGIRESYYGRFTVNLGVLLPCVFEIEEQKPVPPFVSEAYCTIRTRLGSLAFGKDEWFEISFDPAASAIKLVQLLDRFGLPFFEQFSDYPAVLSYFNVHQRLPFQTADRAALEAAIIAHHLGNAQTAKCLFAKAYSSDHEGFRGHVSKLANRLEYKIA